MRHIEKKTVNVSSSENGFGTCRAISRDGKAGSTLPETLLNKEHSQLPFYITRVNQVSVRLTLDES